MYKHFTIEMQNHLPIYDFGMELINAVNAINWYDQSCEWTYELSHEPELDSIPVGSINFVKKWFNAHNKELPKPINKPESLFKYCKLSKPRNIYIADPIDLEKRSFVKNLDVIKHHNNGFATRLEAGNWQICDIIDNVNSEYRMFFMNREIIDIKKYSGDVDQLLTIDQLNHMKEVLNDYSEIPCGTIDFLVTDDNHIELIEVHDFYSVGHYGFNSNKIPIMYYRCFKHLFK